MFRKHPPQQVRYGVCVLEAEEPSECPSKVKLSIKHQQGRCLAWGTAYKKVTTFHFTGESDLDTLDPIACPLYLPGFGWHTSHVLDPVTHACRKRPPVFSSSGAPPCSAPSTSPKRGPGHSSSGVPCSAPSTSHKLDPVHSAYSVSGCSPTTSQYPGPFPSTSLKHNPVHNPNSVSGYASTTSQYPGPITCTSHVAGLDLKPLLRAYSRSREDTEMRVSITRRGGFKSAMLVPLEDFLQRLARRGLEGKKFILRVSEEDKAIDVEAALTLSGEVEDVREGEFYAREMDVMATEAEGRKDREEDEERQDQESDRGRKNEGDGEQETSEEAEEVQGREAFSKESEGVWEGNEGTGKNETVMGERVTAEYKKEVEINEETERIVKETKDEGIWEGNKETRKNETVMGERVNAEHTKEETKTDVRIKRRVKKAKEDNTTQTAMKDSVKEPNNENITSAKEITAQQEPSGGGFSEVTGQHFRFPALLFLLFVSLLVLILSLCA